MNWQELGIFQELSDQEGLILIAFLLGAFLLGIFAYWLAVRPKLKRYKRENRSLNAELETTRGGLSTAQNKITVQDAQIKTLEQTGRQHVRDLEGLKDEKEALTRQLAQRTVELKASEDAARAMRGEMKTLAQLHDDLQVQFKVKEEALTHLEKDLTQADTQRLDEQRQLRDDLALAQESLEISKEQLRELQHDAEQLEQRALAGDRLKEQLERMQNELREMQGQLKSTRQQLHEVEGQRTTLQGEKESLEQALSDYLARKAAEKAEADADATFFGEHLALAASSLAEGPMFDGLEEDALVEDRQQLETQLAELDKQKRSIVLEDPQDLITVEPEEQKQYAAWLDTAEAAMNENVLFQLEDEVREPEDGESKRYAEILKEVEDAQGVLFEPEGEEAALIEDQDQYTEAFAAAQEESQARSLADDEEEVALSEEEKAQYEQALAEAEEALQSSLFFTETVDEPIDAEAAAAAEATRQWMEEVVSSSMEQGPLYVELDEKRFVQDEKRLKKRFEEEALREQQRRSAWIEEEEELILSAEDRAIFHNLSTMAEQQLEHSDMVGTLELDWAKSAEWEEQHAKEDGVEEVPETFEVETMFAPTRSTRDARGVQWTEAEQIVQDAIGKEIPAASIEARDNLCAIQGIGVFLEQKLHRLGIYTFEQIAAFTPSFMKKLSAAIGFSDESMWRDRWVEQAKRLREEV